MRAAVSLTQVSSFAFGFTSLTRPRASASSALKRLAVKKISFAAVGPTHETNDSIPGSGYPKPRRAAGIANDASSAA
jgi:hypothetical protein